MSGAGTPGILLQIAARRRERIRSEGHALGAAVPSRRQTPLVGFAAPSAGLDRPPAPGPCGPGAPPDSRSGPSAGAVGQPSGSSSGRADGEPAFLICEIKRRSPSAGEIAPRLDPIAQARAYVRAGVGHLSILTEEDHFGGSLEDLIAVKHRFPHLAVLRKDFLLDERDIDISYRSGADAVLLIAALHSPRGLARLCRRAEALGLAALVEIHDRQDLEKARHVRPALCGINSRDLSTFRVDRLSPLALIGAVDWKTRLVYESGVQSGEDARVARAAGFQALLVGEAVVRRPALIGELLRSLDPSTATPAVGAGTVAGTAVSTVPGRHNFWGTLAARLSAHRTDQAAPQRPLVKICGLTRAADAQAAVALGADLLGFVFAASPRRAEAALLRELRDLPALKVGVAVSEEGTRLQELLDAGLLDAVQLHGDESPGDCAALAFPYYKAIRLRRLEDLEAAQRYRCPRLLADAWSPQARGGTGERADEALVAALAERQPLWLAGGLGPDNIGEVVRRFRPELVDASSRLESEPGRKDPAALAAFFQEVSRAVERAEPAIPRGGDR